MESFEILDLGRVSYREAFQKQLEIAELVQLGRATHTLILCEHDPVLTLGANFKQENLLFPADWYAERGIEIQKTDRGGDVTYHGPKQLVAYPIFNVAELGKDLHKWMRDLEEVVIRSLSEIGLDGERLEVNSGVWVQKKKVCAIGIKIRKWISMHGIAINCNNNLEPFNWIVPCGIKTHGVTSISEQIGKEFTTNDLKPLIVQQFGTVFKLQLSESMPA